MRHSPFSTALSLATLVNLLGLSPFVTASQPCYFLGGARALDDVPCSSNTFTSCCNSGDLCMSNGLCYVQANRGFVISRGSCTDRSWGASCPQQCHGSNDNMDGGIPIIPIDMSVPNKTQYCCGGVVDNNGVLACADGQPSFTLPPATVVVGRAALSNLTYVHGTTSTATNNSVSIAPTSSSSLCATANRETTTVGAAVGATLGALALAAIGWAVYERRLRKKQYTKYTSMPMQPITGSAMHSPQQQPALAELHDESHFSEMMDTSVKSQPAS